MSLAAERPAPIRTLADLLRRLGGVSPDRIRFRPAPGTATIQDLLSVLEHEGIICELVDGVLVEKIMGFRESGRALFLATLIDAFVRPRNLGLVTGADSTTEIMPDLVRIPDVSFTNWDRIPGRRYPTDPVPRLVPNLAVEVLSRGNPPGEMAVKRQEYFSAGVELVWEIDPVAQTVAVYSSPANPTTLGIGDALTGGTVLPGFAVAVADLFAELDRQG